VAARMTWIVPVCTIAVATACSQRFEFDVPYSSSISSGASAGAVATDPQAGRSTTNPIGATGGAPVAASSGGNGSESAGAGGAPASGSAGAAAVPVCTGHCADWNLRCASEWQACVECNVDEDCSGTRARCGTGALAHRCVECRSDGDPTCPAGTKCEVTTGRCLAACHMDDDGRLDNDSCSTGTTCTSATGFCASCGYDSNCNASSAGSYCHPRMLQCVSCTADTNCTSSLGYCDPTLLICVACRDGRDCASGACDTDTHHCY
jgi:hypothetical protein